MTTKFTIREFYRRYPNEEACTQKVFEMNYGKLTHCPSCSSPMNYRPVARRKAYQCSHCSHQLYPMAGTMFHRSRIPLTYWFFTIFIFSKSKNGLSAAELQRQLGVTYKTAFRMLHIIRAALAQDDEMFEGIVELDESYVGGKNKNRHKDKKVANTQGRSYKDKAPVFGILQRGGKAGAWYVPDVTSRTLLPIIEQRVKADTYVMTDEWDSYNGMDPDKYVRAIVQHGKGQYVDGECHTNGIENFWSIVKRTINGSYVSVSRKYLNHYLNEVVFKFNNKDEPNLFELVLERASYGPVSPQPSS